MTVHLASVPEFCICQAKCTKSRFFVFPAPDERFPSAHADKNSRISEAGLADLCGSFGHLGEEQGLKEDVQMVNNE